MSERKLNTARVDRLIDELQDIYRDTGNTFVLLEVGDPFVFAPGLNPEQDLEDWRQTGELAVERLNAAFDHTPLRFSCSTDRS